MNDLIKVLLLCINAISSFIVVVFIVFGIYEAIMGPQDAEKLLDKLKLKISYKQALSIGFFALLLMMISRFVYNELVGVL